MSVRSLQRIVLIGAVAAFFGAGMAKAQDPPSRIARLNYVTGLVSMQPAGLDDWTNAELNRPLTSGDTIFTDVASRAEFHLDTAVIRAGENTSFGFLTLNDQLTQLSLTEGDLFVTVRDLELDQAFEVDSPNASVSILRAGSYRFRIAADGSLTFVVVRRGQAEVTAGNQAVNVQPGQSVAITGSDVPTYDVETAPTADDFDLWAQERDAAEARSQSARYLPRNVVGYEDMDRYGSWQTVGDFGPVWYPTNVGPGWAPYHNGHWAWIEPWGWTWVDDAPWGFAPFHYGRWAFIAGRWGWCPGPIVVVANRPTSPPRPVYAPALVAWFGGAHFGVSVQIGGGAPSLGWVPLGVGEVYTPAYHCSPHYFNNVNVANTTVVKTVNITNVYNTVYVNKTVYVQNFANKQAPNAVTAMPQTAFASGRLVAQAGVAVAPQQIQSMRAEDSGVVAPPVAPSRQALMASNATSRVVQPPKAVMARQVTVQTKPVAAPAPFAARQAYLQQHAGQPHDSVEMDRQSAPVNAGAANPAVRMVAAPARKPEMGQQQPVGTQPNRPLQDGPLPQPNHAPVQGSPAAAQVPPPAKPMEQQPVRPVTPAQVIAPVTAPQTPPAHATMPAPPTTVQRPPVIMSKPPTQPNPGVEQQMQREQQQRRERQMHEQQQQREQVPKPTGPPPAYPEKKPASPPPPVPQSPAAKPAAPAVPHPEPHAQPAEHRDKERDKGEKK